MNFSKINFPWISRPLPPPEVSIPGSAVADDAPKRKPAEEAEAEDEEDDFITNEVNKRLKELRRNSFMMLIPEEESCAEDDDDVEEETDGNPCEWRDVEAEGRQWWGGFDVIFDKYCEGMLFFDRVIVNHLREAASSPSPLPSPRASSRKLRHPFTCISAKTTEEFEGERELLQHPHHQHDPYQDLETAYLAHVCLSWEALHCQYTQLCKKISCKVESDTCYSHSAQRFQQFHVLLQRFIESEPFENGVRAEIYARSRITLPKLLQVPNINGYVQKTEFPEEDSESYVLHAADLLRVLEKSILTFHVFLKLEKKKHTHVHHLPGNQTQILSLSEKKKQKLKEICRRSRGWKKKSWQRRDSNMELLFALIDMEVVSRVLKMTKITQEQILWCEEKMKKVDLSDGRLRRDCSPLLFPC